MLFPILTSSFGCFWTRQLLRRFWERDVRLQTKKCDRDRYKKLLRPILYEAARNNDLYPPFGLSGVVGNSLPGGHRPVRWAMPSGQATPTTPLSPNGFVAYSYRNGITAAIRNSGLEPLLGGMEHSEDIVKAMDLERMKSADDSLGKLLKELDAKFQGWRSR